jgi:hypothetical protein
VVGERAAVGGDADGEVRDGRLKGRVCLEVVGVEVEDILTEETFAVWFGSDIAGLVVREVFEAVRSWCLAIGSPSGGIDIYRERNRE